ncbi:hypothetical protein B0T20DRAFT_388058 [Sordaria brevicollis]|uniref:AAA+ ATPase domain-containing protein n=1 Tax=Sordaria brevicollis TaxID=83679 RepID=A0AAE0NRA1_SORBR|nr:hypothetical protein B0T20DRAFT_388058 [Sordaria brevicollis]
MTPVAVLAMVENGSSPETGRKPLHPFFTPNRQPVSTALAEPPTVPDQPDATEDSIMSIDEPIEPKAEDDALEKTAGRRSKRRKVSPGPEDDEEYKKPKTRKRTKPNVGPGIANHFIRLGKPKEDAEQEQEERTTTNQEGEPIQQEAELPQRDTTGTEGQNEGNLPAPTHDVSGIIRNLVDVNIRSSPPPPAINVEPPKPTKLLRFNPKTGTIGSPPKPKQSEPVEETAPTIKKRIQPSRAKKPESLVVTIKYSSESDEEARTRVGEKIEAILKAPKQPQRVNQRNKKPVETKKPPAAKPTTAKSTHPFFSGKVKGAAPAVPATEPKNDKPSEPSQKVFMSTPCSPKKPRVSAFTGRMPQFGFNKSDVPLKFPGAKPPAWPWKDMVHVRGEEDTQMLQDIELPLPSRKSKGHSIKVDQDESILNLVGRSVDIGSVRQALQDFNTDNFIPAPPELRLPNKHFESGRKLQQRILSELRTFKPTKASGQLKPPAQLVRLYDSISSSLSAFDQCQCENSNWTQKYAPITAYEVLQPSNEVFLLRNWLHALKVQSVETGSNDSEKPKKGKAVGPGRKKRRKRLDDFIVSSDDEFELDEDSEDEPNWAPSGFRGIARKTVVRSRDLSEKDASKIANTLIISGPHGCGKTAAVYAVAKELDFEVFEINSSSRRSGKDVLEKIGDMTRNHLVQQHQSSSDKAGDDQEDATAEEVKSGKQATMNAFFRPKTAAAKPKQPTKPPPKSEPKDVKKDGGKNQRQSLILLEEVDILYEEDKQFWNTIVTLIAQAKRPFVMTCNDETLLPLHTLRLHGIFRLSPPPKELAVDRLLLVAANEGHALTRQAVASLYESRGNDLRAATTDLQYWCQIGVGDRKGGFDWYYPRWPRGCDLDENGHVVRVVSQSTYLKGMNWLGRDTVVGKAPGRQVEEEILEQAWDSWGLDMGSWQDSVGLDTWAESMPSSGAGRLEALEAFEDLADALSAADLCSSRSFGIMNEEPLDATLPEPPAKARDDNVLGLTPLDSPLLTLHDSLTTALPATIKSLSRSVLRSRTSSLTHQQHPIPPSTEDDTLQPLTESSALNLITKSFTSLSLSSPSQPVINRIDLAFAFDPIATSDSLGGVSYLDPSVFDRTTSLITLDVAPYVRGIVAYESGLQKRRLKMSKLLSITEGGGNEQDSGTGPGAGTGAGVGAGAGAGTGAGGGGVATGKRMRTTRAALSALEGGERGMKRRERWFKGELNPFLVEKTGGRGWTELVLQEVAEQNEVAAAAAAAAEHGQEGGGNVSEASDVSVPWEVIPPQQQQVVSDVNMGGGQQVQQVEVLLKQKPKRGRPRKNLARVVEVDEAESEGNVVQPGTMELAGPVAGVPVGTGRQSVDYGAAGAPEGVEGVMTMAEADATVAATVAPEHTSQLSGGVARVGDADADGDVSMTQ